MAAETDRNEEGAMLPSLAAKVDWIGQHVNADRPTWERIVAMDIAERMVVTKLPPTCASCHTPPSQTGKVCLPLDSSSRDENLHCEFARVLFSMLADKPDADAVSQILQEAIELEENFIRDAMAESHPDLAIRMKQQTTDAAKDILSGLGYSEHDASSFQPDASRMNYFEPQ